MTDNITLPRSTAMQALLALWGADQIDTDMKDAIAALTAAMEQQAEPVLLNGLTEAETNATASVTGLTKQAEPVAWTLTETLNKREPTTRGYLWFSNPQNYLWTPLYTTQPQRKPLTDEQEAAFKEGWQSAKAAYGIKEGT